MDIDPGTLCTWLRIRDCRIRAQTNWVFAPCVVATFSSLRSSHAYLVTTVPVAPCAFSSCCFSTNLKCESHRLRTHTDRGARISHQPEVNECAHEKRSSDRFEPASPHARRSSRPARHRSGHWQSRRAAQTSLHYARPDALGDRASYPSPSELSFGTSRSKALTTGQSADPEQAGHGGISGWKYAEQKTGRGGICAGKRRAQRRR